MKSSDLHKQKKDSLAFGKDRYKYLKKKKVKKIWYLDHETSPFSSDMVEDLIKARRQDYKNNIYTWWNGPQVFGPVNQGSEILEILDV